MHAPVVVFHNFDLDAIKVHSEPAPGVELYLHLPSVAILDLDERECMHQCAGSIQAENQPLLNVAGTARTAEDQREPQRLQPLHAHRH